MPIQKSAQHHVTTIRVMDKDQEYIETIQKFLGCKTAMKAIRFALYAGAQKVRRQEQAMLILEKLESGELELATPHGMDIAQIDIEAWKNDNVKEE